MGRKWRIGESEMSAMMEFAVKEERVWAVCNDFMCLKFEWRSEGGKVGRWGSDIGFRKIRKRFQCRLPKDRRLKIRDQSKVRVPVPHELTQNHPQ